MEKIIGIVRIILYNAKNFTIFKIECNNKQDEICLYKANDVLIGDKLILNGEYEINPKYGKRFLVSSIEKVIETKEMDIEKYLSSSLFIGIGPKIAKKIVEKFGEDTINIINNNIDRLKEVEGIGNKKLLEIKSSLTDNFVSRQIILELTEIGFSYSIANKIYNMFSESSINVVKKDIYSLIDKISGLGFKRVDAIGEKLNIEKDCTNRLIHGIIYVIKERLKFGNTFIPYDQLIKLSKELLNVSEEKIAEAYKEVLTKGTIVEKQFKHSDEKIKCVFLTNIYKAEYNICASLIRLYVYGKNKIKLNTEEEINKFEELNKVKFSEDQKEALVGSINNNLHIITGGPGTGKTTIIKCILNICKKEGLTTIMAAPTGRAAKKMMETTGVEAKTIHRLLEIYNTEDEYTLIGRKEKDLIKCDVLIIDEASMIDVLLGSKLFNSIKIGTKIIIVGDVDQCATRFCA